MAFGNGPQLVTNGLVMNLDAADRNSYPGSGATWYDTSGNGNNGTITNGELVTNTNGGYLQNTGNVSNFFYISVSDSTSISNMFSTTTGGWTIEEVIWTNSTTYPEADAGSVISSAAYGAGNTGFDWNHGYGVSSFQFGQSNISGGSYDDVVIASIPSQFAQFNIWRIRTMIWNRGANTNSLYINNTFIGSGSTPNTAGQSIYDGDGCSLGTLYGWKFYGRRASIRFYNKVLTTAEISQNYNALKTRFGV